MLTRFNNPVVLVVAMVALCIATLATNIAANVVSPANDFAHLAPRRISFRTGGLITGVVGILIMPWKLVADPSGYIFTWLVGYSALLGPIGGILIADYFVWRRRQLDLAASLPNRRRISLTPAASASSRWWHWSSASCRACRAFSSGESSAGGQRCAMFWSGLYNYAWFVGFAIAFVAVSASEKDSAPQVATASRFRSPRLDLKLKL